MRVTIILKNMIYIYLYDNESHTNLYSVALGVLSYFYKPNFPLTDVTRRQRCNIALEKKALKKFLSAKERDTPPVALS